MSDYKDSDFIFARGVVIQVREYYESGGGLYAPMKHQEFWLRFAHGEETHFHLRAWRLPMRQGHVITMIWWRKELTAIMNHTTEQYINLVNPSLDYFWYHQGHWQWERFEEVLRGPWEWPELIPFAIWGLFLLWALTLNRWAVLIVIALIVVPFSIVHYEREKRAWRVGLEQLYAAVERQVQRAAGQRV